MPYDVTLETRIDRAARPWKNLTKKKMFGGVCYLLRGNMCFGIYRDSLIVRLGEEQAARKLGAGKAEPFDITGRAMKGWVMVAGGGLRSDVELRGWLEKGKGFAGKLPPK